VSVALASQATAAPVVFEASGSFQDGFKLSGTITIDTATGKVVSSDLLVAGHLETLFTGTGQHSTSQPGLLTYPSFYGLDETAELVLWIPLHTLVGYKGGALLDYENGIHISSYFSITPEGFGAPTTYYYLIEGSLEPQ
jgi:hypothetical protein